MHKVFVYGTLRKGQGNYTHFLSDSEFVGEAEIKGTMYNMGAYPAILLDGNCKIQGEIFLVDDQTLKRLDGLEGVPTLYRRVRVEIDGEDVWTYVAGQRLTETRCIPNNLIPSGDWVNREKVYSHG